MNTARADAASAKTKRPPCQVKSLKRSASALPCSRSAKSISAAVTMRVRKRSPMTCTTPVRPWPRSRNAVPPSVVRWVAPGFRSGKSMAKRSSAAPASARRARRLPPVKCTAATASVMPKTTITARIGRLIKDAPPDERLLRVRSCKIPSTVDVYVKDRITGACIRCGLRSSANSARSRSSIGFRDQVDHPQPRPALRSSSQCRRKAESRAVRLIGVALPLMAAR